MVKEETSATFTWTESVRWDTRVLRYENEYDGEVILTGTQEKKRSSALGWLVESTSWVSGRDISLRITSPSYSFPYVSTLVSQHTDSVQEK